MLDFIHTHQLGAVLDYGSRKSVDAAMVMRLLKPRYTNGASDKRREDEEVIMCLLKRFVDASEGKSFKTADYYYWSWQKWGLWCIQ